MFAAKIYAAVCGFAAVSTAHMVMANPKPFAGTINSPIDASGSNFPCQMPSYTGSATEMPLGSAQTLSFTGQAVHGGGSCQVSITYDTAPSKSSVWKVIHSIQGGCPAIGQAGNMGDNPGAGDPFTYNFNIPSNIPSGKATLAMSWLNRIGNREYYMNCAPVSLTGSGGSQAAYSALPDMVVANINTINTCSTAGLEGKDYLYPNPGSSVESHPFTSGNLVALNGNCGAAAAAASSSGTTGSTGSGSSSGAGGTASAPGGVFITVATGGASTAAPTAAPVVASAAPDVQVSVAAQPTPAASPPASSSGSSSAGAQTVGAACSSDGQWNCIGGTSYQRCASGLWSAVMPLAAGTKCTGGLSDNINIVSLSGKFKRLSMRFRPA